MNDTYVVTYIGGTTIPWRSHRPWCAYLRRATRARQMPREEFERVYPEGVTRCRFCPGDAPPPPLPDELFRSTTKPCHDCDGDTACETCGGRGYLRAVPS